MSTASPNLSALHSPHQWVKENPPGSTPHANSGFTVVKTDGQTNTSVNVLSEQPGSRLHLREPHTVKASFWRKLVLKPNNQTLQYESVSECNSSRTEKSMHSPEGRMGLTF